jgi:DNA-binding MarR family transcriptional regulator
MKRPADPDAQPLDGTADEILESIHAIMHLHRSGYYQSLRGGPFEVTHMEHKVLGFFARHPDATQSDLVAHSARDKAQLARLIRALRDKGLLQAHADVTDRRSTRLRLTTKGRNVHRQLQEQGLTLAERAVADLNASERDALATLLRRMHDNLADGLSPVHTAGPAQDGRRNARTNRQGHTGRRRYSTRSRT